MVAGKRDTVFGKMKLFQFNFNSLESYFVGVAMAKSAGYELLCASDMELTSHVTIYCMYTSLKGTYYAFLIVFSYFIA